MGISVEASASAGVPLVGQAEVKVTVSVEARFDYSWGGATTEFQEVEKKYPQTISAGCFGVLFQVKSKYSLFRKDGSSVSGEVEIGHNEFYSTQYCGQ